jgi:hypothetical protein
LNERATAVTSSPPCSGARASRSPAPRRSVAALHRFQAAAGRSEHDQGDERCPDHEHTRCDERDRRTELPDDAREGWAAGQNHDPAHRLAGDEYGHELAAPWSGSRFWRRRARRTIAGVEPFTPCPTPAESPRSSRFDELEFRAHRIEQLRRHIVMVREDLPVAHDDDERLQRLPELLVNVVFDVETIVGGEGGAKVGGDERRESSRRRAGIEPAMRSVIQRKTPPSAASMMAEEGDETERDAPIQAAIPARIRHQTSAAL